MGFFSSITDALHQSELSKFSDNTQDIVRKLENYYQSETHIESIFKDYEYLEDTWKQIQAFIDAMDKNLKPSDDEVFNAIVHAYIKKNSQYPERFDTYIAMQYFNQADQKKEDLDGKSSEWFNHKISEVEKHLERISLVKLQLTKNLKELESQGEGHLWIDHEFIEPALDTLKVSLAQVQDIENRMMVLESTYLDHQG